RRAGRRARSRGRRAARPAAPVHRGAPGSRARAGDRSRRAARRHPRRGPAAPGDATALPVPHPARDGVGRVRARRPAALPPVRGARGPVPSAPLGHGGARRHREGGLMSSPAARALPTGAPPDEDLLEVTDLVKHFPITRGILRRTIGHVRAVDGVSFRIAPGETVGLVGESGSGKSTVARLALRLLEPTSGSIRFAGREIAHLPAKELVPLRRRMSIVFQDPVSSFDPRMTVCSVITEPLEAQGISTGREARRRAGELLELVGLSAGDLDRYPHQFSGGQAQRIAIARALSTDPRLLVCDEAVSALDVSVQAQVLNLLRRLQAELDLAY